MHKKRLIEPMLGDYSTLFDGFNNERCNHFWHKERLSYEFLIGIVAGLVPNVRTDEIDLLASCFMRLAELRINIVATRQRVNTTN